MNDNHNPKKSLILFGLNEKLNLLVNLYNKDKLPKVLMLTGKKGIGKFTLVNHFLNYVYDKNNYNLEKQCINEKTDFFKKNLSIIFPNIIHISGDNFKNVKVDDIRFLKSSILKTTILNKERFIILDDIELFNTNSLNSLLKIIEEPTTNNYFILINNKMKPLLETISSRALELNVSLSNNERINIINSLIKKNNLKTFIDFNKSSLTPGNFLIFNNICELYSININDNYLGNIKKLLDLYKKNKNVGLINMILFLTNYYFYNLHNQNKENIDQIIQNKNFVITNINNFIFYNLNQASLINAINNKLTYE